MATANFLFNVNSSHQDPYIHTCNTGENVFFVLVSFPVGFFLCLLSLLIPSSVSLLLLPIGPVYFPQHFLGILEKNMCIVTYDAKAKSNQTHRCSSLMIKLRAERHMSSQVKPSYSVHTTHPYDNKCILIMSLDMCFRHLMDKPSLYYR